MSALGDDRCSVCGNSVPPLLRRRRLCRSGFQAATCINYLARATHPPAATAHPAPDQAQHAAQDASRVHGTRPRGPGHHFADLGAKRHEHRSGHRAQLAKQLFFQLATEERRGQRCRGAAVVLAVDEHRMARHRREMHQVCGLVEQLVAAVESQPGGDADMVQHIDEVAAHGATERGRFLGSACDAVQAFSGTQCRPGGVDGVHGLLQAGRDADRHHARLRIHIVERRVAGREAIVTLEQQGIGQGGSLRQRRRQVAQVVGMDIDVYALFLRTSRTARCPGL